MRKPSSGMGLTKEDAEEQMQKKDKAEERQDKRASGKSEMIDLHEQRKVKWREGVEAGKLEIQRKKDIKEHQLFRARLPYELTVVIAPSCTQSALRMEMGLVQAAATAAV